MLLFIDVETTGLPKRQGAHWSEIENWPRIVSIAWAFVKNSEIVEKHYFVVRPNGFLIPQESTKIHRILHDQAVREGREFRDVGGELIDSLRRHTARQLVAHNLDFDRNVLLSELFRHNLPTHIEKLSTFCTMMEYHRRWGGGKWPKLSEVYERVFGTPYANAHNALADVEACVAIFRALQPPAEVPREGSTAPPVLRPGQSAKSTMQDAEEMLYELIEWSEGQPWFDPSFLYSLQDWIDSGRDLTCGQYNALERLYDRFILS